MTAPAQAGGPAPPPENRGPVAAGALDPTGELQATASDCVHCGFCLPSCPTYQLWGEEMDSPRGRIHLITQALAGAELTEAAAVHFDRCLGCMACVPACPSGVRYDRLIEAARTWSEEPPPGLRPGPARSPRERALRAAIFATFPYPRRLRALVGPLRGAQWARLDRLIGRSPATQRLVPELASALRVAPQGRAGRRAAAPRGTLPGRVPARGERRAVVGMLTGCVQQVFFPEVNVATARVLAAEGCDVIIPGGQGCCGALSLHSGRASEAAGFARRTIAAFERAGVDAVVVNSAGCGSAMKEYGALLADRAAGDGGGGRDGAGPDETGAGWPARAEAFSGKVRDLSEFLAELFGQAGGVRAARHELKVTAAYHDACHLAHAQRIRQQPRDLLAAIPGLEIAEVGDGGTCCGSAGVYNLLQPEAARELGQRKAAAVQATGAALMVSANPGCSLQIAAALADAGGAAPAVAHIAEVLDASIRGLPVTTLTGADSPPPARAAPRGRRRGARRS
ncbi:MAG TPA: heterodisulfide reductase-related iron-sulfur binding cluster [Streptosporangiaceae bacterium]|nr:heterodisulfide reductase-related iron-sulfur binding cluster [Streptosporangiaceae bacterium]